jgi:hypothetical protein
MDECPIPTKGLIHHPESTRQRHRTLRVLLGCRTADWPGTLGARLRTLLPNFKVVELLPLGRTDIATLAAIRGVDGGAFLAAVVDAGAVGGVRRAVETTGAGSRFETDRSLRRKDLRPFLPEYRPVIGSAPGSTPCSPRTARCRTSWRRWPASARSC